MTAGRIFFVLSLLATLIINLTDKSKRAVAYRQRLARAVEVAWLE